MVGHVLESLVVLVTAVLLPPEDDPMSFPLSVTIHNDCDDMVRLVFGAEPRPWSYVATLYGRMQWTTPIMPGETVWLVEPDRAPIASVTVTLDTSDLFIPETCRSIS